MPEQNDIKNKLQSLLSQKGLMTGAAWKEQAETTARQRAEGAFEIDRVLEGETVGSEEDGFYRVQNEYPLDAFHGTERLGSVFEAIPEHLAFSACDSELDGFDPATACFIDTETTGLAGGTGTVAFLVGIGYFTQDRFCLEQCFMRDYPDEEPMLQYLDERFQSVETVVSYNGKTFDLPLLRTRFIQNRIPFRLEGAVHFDLLHAARRFWRRRLQDCRLGAIETSILGVRRQGDIPSAEIPQIWLDYLRSRDARRLDSVFYHHRMDILSLVALTGALSQSLAVAHDAGFSDCMDQISLVRVHYRQKQYDAVIQQGRRLLDAEAEPPLRRECLEMMGFASKRQGDYRTMEEIWQRLLEEFPQDLIARHELAKHYEHRAQNLAEAARICEETLHFLDIRKQLSRNNPLDDGPVRAFQKRLERIRRKLGRRGGGFVEEQDPS